MTFSFVWHGAWPVPEDLAIRQVYGWIVSEAGHVLLLDMDGMWNLPGGTPETRDSDWEATLRREVTEEADVTLRDVVPLGYQVVQSADVPPFAQVRAAARVDEWLAATPDPDTGRLYRRVWVPLDRATDLLGWGESGHAQAVAAAQVGSEIYGFTSLADLARSPAHNEL